MGSLAICPECGKSMSWGARMCQFCRWVQQQHVQQPKRSSATRIAGQQRWHKRSTQAPGLRRKARRALMAKWKKQHRTCAYCPRPCEVMDHVLPLIRGGTNFEGNLAPACVRCNLAKSDDLLIRWLRKRALTCDESRCVS